MGSKQVFNFVGYQFDLKCGRVHSHTGPVADSSTENSELLSRLACPVWQFMSLIGLLAATEMQDNVLQGQPLHLLKHAMQIFTDTSKERCGTHEHTARGAYSKSSKTG